MTLFLVLGGIGIVLLLVSLLVGDFLDGALEFGGDLISGPALAAFLGAFGFGGALALNAGAGTLLAIVIGLALGVAIGLGAGWAGAQLNRGGDSANVRTSELIGRTATVVTTIPAGGFGTVSIVAAGHITSLNARSMTPLTTGAPVTITAVLSPTSVAVEAQPQAAVGAPPEPA